MGPRPARSPASDVAGTEDVDPISVVIVDEWLCASLLADYIGRDGSIEVVGIAVDLDDAIDLLRTSRPRFVITDVQLRNGSLDAVSALRDADPDVKVIVLTHRTDATTVQAAFDAGCAGYLTKRQTPDEVVRAIRAAVLGDVPVEPALLTELLGTEPVRAGPNVLTMRERAVLRLFGEGRTNTDVAQRLSLSVNTVRNHAQRILVKLGAHSKLEAVLIARRMGLLDD